MKMTGTNLTWLIVGCAVGGVSGYLITDLLIYKLREREFATKPNEWVDSEGVAISADWAKAINEGKIKTDYTKYSKGDLDELVKAYLPELAPFIIPLEAWEDNEYEYEKHTILFYTEDAVFTQENGDVIKSPQNQFGPNIHLHFGEASEDEDVVYVSNPGLESLYEILRIHESHEKKEEEPKKVEPKRASRAAAKQKAKEKETEPPVKRRARAAPPVEEVVEESDDSEEDSEDESN